MAGWLTYYKIQMHTPGRSLNSDEGCAFLVREWAKKFDPGTLSKRQNFCEFGIDFSKQLLV
jgi:hypothetical protein